MTIYSEFSHKKWWFSIVVLVYQRVRIYIYIYTYNSPILSETGSPITNATDKWGFVMREPWQLQQQITKHLNLVNFHNSEREGERERERVRASERERAMDILYIYIALCAPGNLAWQLCSATCHFNLRIGYNRCRTNKPMSVEGLVVAQHIGLAPSLELRWRVVSLFTTPKLGFRIFCPGSREHLLRKAMFLDGQRVNLWFPQCSLKSVSCETHLISSWWAPAT